MKEKLKIDRPVLVEGKYDKITLLSIIDANVIPLGGFSVFNSEQTKKLIMKLAEKSELILLTDPDGGGRQIRSFVLSLLPKDRVHQLHIPALEGKESRKKRPSRSGTLGVEGMSREVIERLFMPFVGGCRKNPDPISSLDLYRDGLSGGEGSATRRQMLARRLDLPTDLSSKALLEAINLLITRAEYEAAVAELFAQS